MLSLLHLFWLEEARRAMPSRLQRLQRFSICGDDALVSTTTSVATRYKELVSAFKGEASAGKHFECTGPGMMRRAVYLEKLFEFTTDR